MAARLSPGTPMAGATAGPSDRAAIVSAPRPAPLPAIRARGWGSERPPPATTAIPPATTASRVTLATTGGRLRGGLAGDRGGVGVGDEEAGGAGSVGGGGVDARGSDTCVDRVGDGRVVEPLDLVVDRAGFGQRVVFQRREVEHGRLPGGE